VGAPPDLSVPIARHVIGSANVHWVGYDEPSQTLEIAFHSGHTYRYGGVDRAIALPLLEDGEQRRIATETLGRWSYGGYVALIFRVGGRFPYVRVE